MISQEQRILDVTKYLDAAMDICSTSSIDAVREVGNFLVASAMIAVPPGKGEEPQELQDMGWYAPHLACRGNVSPLRFFSLYAEDFCVSKEEGGPLSHAEGCYSQGFHAVMLHPDLSKESPFRLGCLVIHEAKHGLYAVQEGRSGFTDEEKPQSTKERAKEELIIYSLEMELWRERDPHTFQHLLDSMVSWLAEQHQKHGDLPGDAVFTGTSDFQIADFPEFDNLLGPLPPESSPAERLSMLQIFAHYELIDRSEVSNKQLRKRRIVQQIYRDKKIRGY